MCQTVLPQSVIYLAGHPALPRCRCFAVVSVETPHAPTRFLPSPQPLFAAVTSARLLHPGRLCRPDCSCDNDCNPSLEYGNADRQGCCDDLLVRAIFRIQSLIALSRKVMVSFSLKT